MQPLPVSGVTVDGRSISGVNLDGRQVKMYSGGGGGATSRPLAWSGGGSTKPPAVDNYLDSHGFNSGLGNASHTKFPSVVETKPMQVFRQKEPPNQYWYR